MKKRLITSAFMLLVVAVAFVSRLLTNYIFDFMILTLAVMGSVEVARVLERQKKPVNIYLVGSFPALLYVGFILCLKLKATWEYYVIALMCLLILYFACIVIITLAMKKTLEAEMEKSGVQCKKGEYAVDKAMYTLSVLVYPGLLFMCIVMINHLGEFMFATSLGYSIDMVVLFALLLVFVVTATTDSMALVVGKSLKGPKLCPLISPNKTISGAVGGLIFGVVSGMLLLLIFNYLPNFLNQFSAIGGTVWHILIISFVGSIISQCGDLVASSLKRKARVSDYGTIFPGHGGVMDRVDGLIFNALVVLIAFMLII